MDPESLDRELGAAIATAADATTRAPAPESDAARAQALARAGHLLKAPLAVIKGSATTLLAGQWDTTTQQELLALIDAQTDQLLRLLNGLLAVWRMEAGAVALRLTPVRLAAWLDELAVRWAATGLSRAIHMQVPDDLPAVTLDAERLGLALDHVVRFAAWRLVDDAPISIEARANDGTVTLLMTARGVALSEDTCARLFEPLGETSDQGEMAGLALVSAVVHAHGGQAAAEAVPDGPGLRVRLTLPVNPVGSEIRAAPAWDATAGERHNQHGPRTRPVVLVAERDARLARLLRANLEAQGYRALVADDARRLTRLVDQEDPDLVLLDAQFGDLASGQVPLWSDNSVVPVIVLGASEEAACVRALDQGAVDYLAKPFGVGELLARVRAALRVAARRREEEAHEPPFRSGELTIDAAQRQVRLGERVVPLSRTEYKLLRALAQHAGRVLAHEQLLERVWGPGYGQEVEFLWVYVRRLRRKIEPDPSHPRYILTVPGVGYRLAQL